MLRVPVEVHAAVAAAETSGKSINQWEVDTSKFVVCLSGHSGRKKNLPFQGQEEE